LSKRGAESKRERENFQLTILLQKQATVVYQRVCPASISTGDEEGEKKKKGRKEGRRDDVPLGYDDWNVSPNI
jgi:hypothetical protein